MISWGAYATHVFPDRLPVGPQGWVNLRTSAFSVAALGGYCRAEWRGGRKDWVAVPSLLEWDVVTTWQPCSLTCGWRAEGGGGRRHRGQHRLAWEPDSVPAEQTARQGSRAYASPGGILAGGSSALAELANESRCPPEVATPARAASDGRSAVPGVLPAPLPLDLQAPSMPRHPRSRTAAACSTAAGRRRVPPGGRSRATCRAVPEGRPGRRPESSRRRPPMRRGRADRR